MCFSFLLHSLTQPSTNIILWSPPLWSHCTGRGWEGAFWGGGGNVTVCNVSDVVTSHGNDIVISGVWYLVKLYWGLIFGQTLCKHWPQNHIEFCPKPVLPHNVPIVMMPLSHVIASGVLHHDVTVDGKVPPLARRPQNWGLPHGDWELNILFTKLMFFLSFPNCHKPLMQIPGLDIWVAGDGLDKVICLYAPTFYSSIGSHW